MGLSAFNRARVMRAEKEAQTPTPSVKDQLIAEFEAAYAEDMDFSDDPMAIAEDIVAAMNERAKPKKPRAKKSA